MQKLATGWSPLGLRSSRSPRTASRTPSPRACGSSSRRAPERLSRGARALIGVAALLALAPIASAQNRPTPSSGPTTPTLADADVRVYARLLAMTDARRIDDALIVEALGSRSATVRHAAVLAIGQVKARSHTQRLIAL